MPNKEFPYIKIEKMISMITYNPRYGDNRICQCGHPYSRHFDTFDNMLPIGCKYCECFEFKEVQKNEGN